MEKENYGFSDSELTVLRRLWEIQKKQFLDFNKLSADKHISGKTAKLWKKFRVEGVYNLLNGGPHNFISAHEDILYASEWVSHSFEIEGSPFDMDAVRRYNH